MTPLQVPGKQPGGVRMADGAPRTKESRPGLLFYCQHSLGIGHLMRSFALCEALGTHFSVQLLCGGRLPAGIAPPGGFEIVSLPPIAANLDFSLVSHDAEGDLEQTFTARAAAILDRFHALRPSVVVIELFPFGRKKFARELIPLLEAARQRPGTRVVCSLRDLLVGRPNQADHDERVCETANAYFDLVLVHADPRFARLEETFHPRSPLTVPVCYTGYVVRSGAPVAGKPGPGTRPVVVVSAGSGAQGEALLRAAADAQPEILRTAGLGMRIIAGPHVPVAVWAWLQEVTPDRPGLEVVRVVPALLPELRQAAVSVSQCGYNTILEVLQSGAPALVVPAIDEGDQERERAGRLERLGVARVLDRARLTPETLAEEIRRALAYPAAAVDLDLNGAQASLDILLART